VGKAICKINDVYLKSFYDIEIDPFWNIGEKKELKIHKIHAYPAKFPAFILEKGLEYASKYGDRPSTIADVFCGCGTVAFEAKRQNIDFWGCDINPVATLIAKTKSNFYNINRLNTYMNLILEGFDKVINSENPYKDAMQWSGNHSLVLQ
jgi:DNA modification methylase